ncbi:MAG TPA: hypothetical protein VK285_05320, partial [Gaiellaceae bacterium]|nr:hypothetical protein [Gaiellaceae bacterium]
MPRRSIFATATAVLALTAVVAGCGGSDDESSDNTTAGSSDGGMTVTVTLDEQNGSGESGTATLTAEGASTKVVLELENPASPDPQPAHIHKGTCAELDPTPAYPLTNVEGGNSETTVKVALAELESGDFAINVHKSEPDIKTYVSCGNIGEGGGSDSGSG